MNRSTFVDGAVAGVRVVGGRAVQAVATGALAVPALRRRLTSQLTTSPAGPAEAPAAALPEVLADPAALSPDQRMDVAVQEVGWMQNGSQDHPLRAPVVDAFHRMFYDEALHRGGTWHQLSWRGARVWKLPADLWQYQELISSLRPDVVVECGTAFGGSALFMADVCEAVGHGRVVTVDIQAQPDLPHHDRIRYISGSSIDPDVVRQVRDECAGAETVLVILDSDHSSDHVLAECRTYADIVSDGSYLLVEDSNVNGHPVLPDHGPGPMEAILAFTAEDPRFVHDTSRDKMLFSFNPEGWLRKEVAR